MKSLLALAALTAVIVILLLGTVAWTDPAAQEQRQVETAIAMREAAAVAPLGLIVKRIWLGTLGALGIAVGIAALGTSIAWARYSNIRSAIQARIVHAHHALYPVVAEQRPGTLTLSTPVNEQKAQIVAALTNGVVTRLPGGAVKPIVNPSQPDEALLPAGGRSEIAADKAVAVDMIEKPHWLIVGQTGSGKSTATRYILSEVANRYPAEFIICEPGGVDWNSQANARSEPGIAAAVAATYAELERRQDLLRRADLQHVSQLRDLPYVVLVVEEMEAVLDNLRDLDKEEAKNTLIRLRNIARLGRKSGIALVAVTQAARTDVFDSHVRTNLANVLLFRNSQTTAEMFRLKDVTLPSLPTGTAYSLTHGAYVKFPKVVRPVLPTSPLYREDPNVIDVTPATVTTVATDDEEAAYLASFGAVAPVATVVERIPDGRCPTAEEAAAMREHYARHHSKTRVCMTFYGYKDGDVWNYVAAALRGDL